VTAVGLRCAGHAGRGETRWFRPDAPLARPFERRCAGVAV